MTIWVHILCPNCKQNVVEIELLSDDVVEIGVCGTGRLQLEGDEDCDCGHYVHVKGWLNVRRMSD